ncbi:hypothetical protein K501DRAFT_332318 [Backusella circina FSU 941]|nr:hypothetical protein K501DRAFT_332318 [Backusella circina FSU 941]
MAAFSYHNYDSVISIDFGTTYSGTCYTFTSKLKDEEARKNIRDVQVIHVTDWPEQKGKKLLKIPTVCIYNSRTNKLFKWGADAFKYWNDTSKSHDNMKYVEKFKLKLQSTRTKGKQILLENDDGSLHVKATNDFLKAIYEYTFKEMEKASIERGAIDKSRIRFVLTVPAQWTDDDRKLLRLICIEAGLISEKDHENRMHIINESFASTIYCERDLASRSGAMNFEKGKRYLICDAGGGTVDLATYESTGPDEELHNLCNGRCQLTFDRGQNCGSVFVDEKMKDLLLEIVFVNEEERVTYKDVFGGLLKQFIDSEKPNFDYTEEDEEAENDDEDDDNNIYYHLTNLDIRNFSRSTLSQSKYFGPANFGGEATFNFNEMLAKKANIQYITISKKEIKEKVFDKVVDDTLKLVKRQIERSNFDIKTTFLLGGFGKSPYLQKRLKEKQDIFKTGEIITDTEGESAAMRGALYYGLDFIRRDELSDIDQVSFNNENDQSFKANDHEVLISIDVGYEFSSATYTMLKTEKKEPINIDKWPGDQNRENIDWPNHRKVDKYKVPTALFEAGEVENLQVGAGAGLKWGYDALASNDNGSIIVPSSHLALLRDDFKVFLAKYLRQLNDYICRYVQSQTKIDRHKYRFCVTMENSYRFFDSKEDMREIAIDAGVISKNDSSKRLLLINREDACAIYHENKHYGIKTDYHKNIFLQLFVANDHIRLTVHQSTAIATLDQKIEEQKKDRDPFSFLNDDNKADRLFRNVRTTNSITFPFKFIERLVYNFDSFITNDMTIEKNKSNETIGKHPTHTFKCKTHDKREECFDYTEANIREGFLDYIKKNLDFDDNSKNQTISINKEKGCEISISVHDLIEFVFKITYKELAFNLRRYITERDITSAFRIDNIFLMGTAVESEQAEANDFMFKILAKEITDIVSVDEERIKLVKFNKESEGQEVLKGVSFYGLNPEKHTQKISRKSYAIHVIAFEPEKRKVGADDPLKEGEEEELKRTEFEFFKDETPVPLETQKDNKSTEIQQITDDDLVPIMEKGTDTSYLEELYGINRRFFAKKECLVYATIYVTEIDREKITEWKISNEQFRKIHQFEIEVRKSKNKNLKIDGEKRLDFSIRLYVDNQDTKFKADSANSAFIVPEYRYRDEFKVTNIY